MSVLSFDEKSRGRRIKIWLDELPTSALLPIATDEHQSSFEAMPNITYRSLIAIEVLKPYGPTFGYGLIGIEFKATADHRLALLYPLHGSQSEIPYPGSIAGALDKTSVGGLAEYAVGIHRAVQNFDTARLPSGSITIKCMVHGAIGSSVDMFGRLTRAAIGLLTEAKTPASLDEAGTLLEG